MRRRWRAKSSSTYTTRLHGDLVGYFEDPGSDESGYGSYVLAWAPEELEEVVNSGIEVNPEACIAWLDQANVGVRSIIEMLQVT